LGNHSETAFVAAGQFADSPNPNKNLKPAKLFNPVANDVRIEITEYENTVKVNPNRVPILSTNLPNAV